MTHVKPLFVLTKNSSSDLWWNNPAWVLGPGLFALVLFAVVISMASENAINRRTAYIISLIALISFIVGLTVACMQILNA